jgi:hypothetical protein
MKWKLEIGRVFPTPDLHHSALKWAEKNGQSKTYAAHYLAVAENLGFDGGRREARWGGMDSLD